jgi:hypothetical protein
MREQKLLATKTKETMILMDKHIVQLANAWSNKKFETKQLNKRKKSWRLSLSSSFLLLDALLDMYEQENLFSFVRTGLHVLKQLFVGNWIKTTNRYLQAFDT